MEKNKSKKSNTFVNILQNQANHSPDKIAFTFVEKSGKSETPITYSELDKRARIIAGILQSKNLQGERALLLYPPGLEYISGFFGCLYAGVIAVPVYPPDPTRLQRSLPRLQGIIKDSQAKFALTTGTIHSMFKLLNMQNRVSKVPVIGNVLSKATSNKLKDISIKELRNLNWITTDKNNAHFERKWVKPQLDQDTIAYLQYTSGSTGTPRGVIITHNNLIYNSEMIKAGFGLDSTFQGVIWLPIYHDMGLIGGILQPIFQGFHSYLMSPIEFLKRPSLWLNIISKIKNYPIVSGGPNFAYDLCIRRTTPEKSANLDLSNWEVAFSGAEPVRKSTIEGFSKAFSPSGFKKKAFYPCYGLAEATLIVSGGSRWEEPNYLNINKKKLENGFVEKIKLTHPDSLQFVGSGKKLLDEKIAIVDPESKKTCEKNRVGEIWVNNPSIAAGYWKNKDATREIFHAFTNDTKEGPFLRTGDLGFLKEGELFVTGRLKDLIIINGRNHYPQDIEFTVENSNSIFRPGCVAAFSIDVNNEEKLVVVQEVRTKNRTDWDEIILSIREAILNNHELQVYSVILIEPRTIFKTSSGKIQRSATKKAYLSGQLATIKEWQIGSQADLDQPKVPKEKNQGEIQKAAKEKSIIFNERVYKIESWIVQRLAETLEIDAKHISIDEPFVNYGLDSAKAVGLVGDLENWFGRTLSPTIIWDYPSIRKISHYLVQDENGVVEIVPEKFQPNLEYEPIAIVGLSCRFPGAKNLDEFWHLLENGGDAIKEVPPDRWDINFFHDPDPDAKGKMVSRFGGFLEDVDKFDAHFFGISPREVIYMDPQQRILLEVFWEAMENAGIRPESLAGTKTGVFIGIGNHDYSQFNYGNYEQADSYTGTGNAYCIAANRISYLFDLQGPSLAVDTACSSSLYSTHLASKSLLNGESDVAIAGGINLILTPDVNISLSKARMLSPSGRCKTFDSEADGYVRSEGCGIVVLKRLSDAVRDGNKIFALIRGSATNQDGKSNGITAPSRLSQEAVIRAAMQDSRITPEDVSYIEAHGTGTPLGDPIEIQALQQIYKNRTKEEPVVIGSVKTNIGHLEAAAGIAGMIKSILSFNHNKIPQHIHFNNINPRIPIDQLPFKIPTQNMDWPKGKKSRIATVSSFGFGGANAHLVLEEPPNVELKENVMDRPKHILTISTKDEKALPLYLENLEKFISQNNNQNFADFCYSLNNGRSPLEHRIAVVAKDSDEFNSKLNSFLREEQASSLIKGSILEKVDFKTAFLFTGQGAQYPFMGKELYRSQPAFKDVIDECSEILNDHLEKPLLTILFPETKDSVEIHETAYTQPALFVIEYALAKLWKSWGVEPQYLIGHSIGEYVAACFANVFSLEDGLKLVSARGRLMQSLPGGGKMAAVFSDYKSVLEIITDFKENVSIAGVNGPLSTVISGDGKSIEAIIKILADEGIKTKLLVVSHAFHSPLMEPILDEFENIAGEVQYSPARLPIISNLTGKILEKGQIQDSVYWKNHIREAVRFADGMKTLSELGITLFLETGPHPTLISMGRSCLPDSSAIWVPSLKREKDDWETILTSLGTLYVNGFNPNWQGFEKDFNRTQIELPTYPFRRQRYWVGSDEAQGVKKSDGKKQISFTAGHIHPLVGYQLKSPFIKDVVFESRFNAKSLVILDDHRIYGLSLVPATAYMEMILGAAQNAFGDGLHVVENLLILEGIFIPEENYTTVQISLSVPENDRSSFQIFCLTPEDGGDSAEDYTNDSWKLHSTGTVKIDKAENRKTEPEQISIAEIQERCHGQIEVDVLYKVLQKNGFNHGKSLQIVREIWNRDGETLGYVSLNDESASEAELYSFHPALSDAGTQLIAAALGARDEFITRSGIYLPIGIEQYKVNKPGVSKAWCHVRVRNTNGDKNTIESDLRWYNDDTVLVAEIIGLRHKYITMDKLKKMFKKSLNDWLYELEWREQELDISTINNEKFGGNWIIFSDRNGFADNLAEQISTKGGKCFQVFIGKSYKQVNNNAWEIHPDQLENYKKIINEITNSNRITINGIVHLWSLDVIYKTELTTPMVESDQKLLLGSVLNLIQAFGTSGLLEMPQIWLGTQGGQSVLNSEKNLNVSHSPLWGLGNVISLELPEFRCVRVDLDPDEDALTTEKIIQELSANGQESQVAFREGKRFIPRLVHSKMAGMGNGELVANDTDIPKKLEIKQRGVLDNLALVPMIRQRPQPKTVEIRVNATGLNFRDVMNALDLYPGDPGALGGECSGIVTAVGEGINHVQVGDAVMGIAPGSFSSFVITYGDLVVKKPESLSFEEAATIPIPFLTAFYTLHKLAGMKKGDRVFIHSASGGVGLAAIQLAKNVGAEIFGTAGNEEKRGFLKSIGIKNVMDSRSLDFAEEVKSITGGQGVNILLNSLTSDYIPKGLSIMAENGSFLEIGKVGIWDENQVNETRPDVNYYTIALDKLSEDKPELIQEMLKELALKFDSGELKPLKHKTYKITNVKDAFRFMAQAKHIGKIVISQNRIEENKLNEIEDSIKPDGVYLITGGLGALGLLVAEWLVEKKAENIVLASRRQPSGKVQKEIDGLQSAGTTIYVESVDIGNETEVAELFQKYTFSGIIHAAGMLDDGVLMQQDWSRFEKVLLPKVAGSWNLHEFTKDLNLDFMVYFSSAASLLGSPGQGNYAAANAFLDTLAYYRTANGLPAVSINWGPWSDVGMAADLKQQRPNQAKMQMISPKNGLLLFEEILASNRTQIGVLPIQWKPFLKQFDGVDLPSIFLDFIQETEEDSGAGIPEKPVLVQKLEEAQPVDRKRMVVEYLQNQTIRVMGMDSDFSINPKKPLQEMGLDSLMAIELKNALDMAIGRKLPVTMIFNYPTIDALASHLLTDVLKFDESDAILVEADKIDENAETILSEVEEMTDEEAEELLLKKLNESEGAE